MLPARIQKKPKRDSRACESCGADLVRKCYEEPREVRAARYGVAPTSISNVLLRRTWAHV